MTMTSPPDDQGALVEMSDLGKRFGEIAALSEVSFTIQPGEVVGLLGPNGAGKTTLISCLLGFLLPSAGHIKLFGQDVATLPPALRGRTGFVPQKLTGFTHFRVGELIDYLGQFYAVPPGRPPESLLDWAGLDMAARVKALSGGQSQRLAIMLALRHQPDLLILDEPVASLDPQGRRDFMALLTDYCARSGRSALISSHILTDLDQVVTRAIFMRRGRVIHDTPMRRLRERTRWLVPAPGTGPLRPALPPDLTVLAEAPDTGAMLVDGWDEASGAVIAARLGRAVETRVPDLETAFLEITR